MNILKTIITAFASLSLIACSSTPQANIEYEKVGRVKKVELMLKEVKPSFVEVAVGATLGGLLGNQFGGGSGKYWTTSIGALAGAGIMNEALSEKYKEIHYTIYYPEDRSYDKVVSKDLEPTVFKNNLVIIKRKNDDYIIDAYGKYSKERYENLKFHHKNGNLE